MAEGLRDILINILRVSRENNRMLKQLINYLNYNSANAENENNNDFIRNIIANIVSNRFPQVGRRK